MPRQLPAGFTFTEGIPDERYSEWLDRWLGQFGTPPGGMPEVVDFYRENYPAERAIAIADQDGYVATNTSLHRDLVVPGGATVPVAACTGGSCHPTLARQGLMRATLDRLHERAQEEGKALCVGGVSEWPIYRRFGYGPATWYDSVEIDIKRARLRPDTPGREIRPRRVSGAEARQLAEQIYTRATAAPGEVVPPSTFWKRLEEDNLELEQMLALAGMGGPRHCVVIEDRAFVSYRLIPEWTDEQAPVNIVHVIDFIAVDAEAAAAMWWFLFSIDMAAQLHLWRLPVDDPIRWWVVDARWIRGRRKDGLWLRPIDLPRLLESRTWARDGALTLTVHDTQGFTTGTYRLEVEAGQGRCRRVSGEPDLELDVSALGAILLGGTSATSMAKAGVIKATDPRHLWQWDTMATPEVAPFVNYWF